jgi:hypothetical protein
MMNRSLSFAAAVGALVLAGLVPHQASALPGAGVAETQAQPALVHEVASKYNRRYYRDNGTYVRAPFAEVDTRRDTWVAAPFSRVYSGRRGTWVRAPFVDLWVPR